MYKEYLALLMHHEPALNNSLKCHEIYILQNCICVGQKYDTLSVLCGILWTSQRFTSPMVEEIKGNFIDRSNDGIELASSFNRGAEFKLHLKSCIAKRKWWLSYMSN